jgi:hypothetical protein
MVAVASTASLLPFPTSKLTVRIRDGHSSCDASDSAVAAAPVSDRATVERHRVPQA